MNPITTSQPVRAVLLLTDNGASVTPDSLAWSSNNEAVSTVDPVSGVCALIGPGMCQIIGAWTFNSPSGPKSGNSIGVLTVTQVGDNLVGAVDFVPVDIAA